MVAGLNPAADGSVVITYDPDTDACEGPTPPGPTPPGPTPAPEPLVIAPRFTG